MEPIIVTTLIVIGVSILGSFIIVVLLQQKRSELQAGFDQRLQMEQQKMQTRIAEETKTLYARFQGEYRTWQETYTSTIRDEQRGIAFREAETQLQKWKHHQEQTIRKDAITKSQAVILGKVTEHVIPYLPEFCYNPKDARFIGSPVDFLVFDGLDSGEVQQVVFIEIKTGKSTLSTRERQIRDAVQSGRVQWVELRINRQEQSVCTPLSTVPVILPDITPT